MIKSHRIFSTYIVVVLAFVALSFQPRETFAQQPINVLVVFTDDAKESVQTAVTFLGAVNNDLDQYVSRMFLQANTVLQDNFAAQQLPLPAQLVPVEVMWGLKDSSGNPFNEHAFSNYGSMQEEIQAHMSDYLLGSTPIETWRQAYEADVVLVVTLAGVLGNSAGAAGVATPPGFNPNLAVLDAVMGGWPGDPNFRFLLIHEILHLLGLTHEEDGGVDHVNQTCTVMATPCPSGYTRTTDIVPMAKVIAATGLLRLADLHENGGAPGSGSGGGGFPPDDTPGPVSLYGFVYDCTPGYAITSSSFSPVVQPPVSHYYFSLLGDQNSASYELTITLHPYYFGPMMEQSWPITWGGIVGPGSHDIYANWPGDVTVETRAFSSLGTPGPWTDAYVSATCFSVETG